MKRKNVLLKVLLTLGIGYALYKVMQAVVNKLTEEEKESKHAEKRNDKGSSPEKGK